MTIARMTLTDFRSYESARLDIDRPLVVLVGENGAGKTNALEALSLFAPGRGLRGAALEEMMRQGAGPGWGVHVTLADGRALATGVSAEAPRRRAVRFNGNPAPLSEISRQLPMLWLTPAQDRLFLDAPSDRRRFLDRLVLALHPDHGGHVARYEHAARERLKLLGEGPADPVWLTALERRIAEHGVAAAAARLEVVEQLAPLAAAPPSDDFPAARIALDGDVEARLASGLPALAVEDALREQLAAARGQDAVLGRSSIGPGRCDLKVWHRPKEQSAALCSTGEQKALLVGLMLAQAQLLTRRLGKPPLLLLDEIAAHLDERRRSGLFELLHDLRIPCWMTGTDDHLFASLASRAARVSVQGGSFHQRKA
jgi:DNA replication and repair protein RecF